MSIAIYKPEDTKVYINGTEIFVTADIVISPSAIRVDLPIFPITLCKCGKERDYGCHGVKDREVYSEYYCKECYHKEHE